MTFSNLDPTWPPDSVAVSKSDFRYYMSTIKSEIERLGSELKSVKTWFGAVGDGITDDTVAFQTAIASGANLWIDPGTYKISFLLNLNHPSQHIYGAGIGATTIVPTGFGANLFSFSQPDCSIRDLSIDGTAMTSGRAVVASGSRFYGKNLYLLNPYAGISLGSTSADSEDQILENIIVQNIQATTTTFAALDIFRVTHAKIANFRGSAGSISGPYGIRILAGSDIEIDKTYLNGFLNPVYADATGGVNPTRVGIKNLICTGSGTEGLYINTGTDYCITNFYVGSSGSNGVALNTAVRRVHMANGVITGSVQQGINILGKDIDLIAVSCTENGTGSPNNDGVRIGATGASVRIVGGKYGQSEGGTNNQKYGINILAGGARVVAYGVDLTGNVTAPYNDANAAPSTNSCFSDSFVLFPSLAKASLPSAATNTGRQYHVTDATGGASLAYSNGANWISLRTGAAV